MALHVELGVALGVEAQAQRPLPVRPVGARHVGVKAVAPAEVPAQTVCSVPAEVARPPDATSQGCSGWAGAEPPAQGTSHAAEKQSVCRSGYLQAEDLDRLGRGRPPG